MKKWISHEKNYNLQDLTNERVSSDYYVHGTCPNPDCQKENGARLYKGKSGERALFCSHCGLRRTGEACEAWWQWWINCEKAIVIQKIGLSGGLPPLVRKVLTMKLRLLNDY